MEIDLGKGPWAKAVFAGGCFWCMEEPFDTLEGVVETVVGYTGGTELAPDYGRVSSGATGHAEAILVLYDPERISYERLLEIFWRNIDPTQPDGQFFDRGPQYRTEIFVLDEEQRRLAEASRAALAASGRFSGPLATRISPAGRFWSAEEYHQDYYRKNSLHYDAYKRGSGREGFCRRVWGGEEKTAR